MAKQYFFYRDDDDDWYLVPRELEDKLNKDLERTEEDEEYYYNGFGEDWKEYRISDYSNYYFSDPVPSDWYQKNVLDRLEDEDG